MNTAFALIENTMIKPAEARMSAFDRQVREENELADSRAEARRERMEAVAPELVEELKAADRIILAMLATMTLDQKLKAMEALGTDQLTRHNERRLVLMKAGVLA